MRNSVAVYRLRFRIESSPSISSSKPFLHPSGQGHLHQPPSPPAHPVHAGISPACSLHTIAAGWDEHSTYDRPHGYSPASRSPYPVPSKGSFLYPLPSQPLRSNGKPSRHAATPPRSENPSR